ncbi:MAG TPA: immune inhibitor A domain-containing protein [Acidimicrobiia bacterium]
MRKKRLLAAVAVLAMAFASSVAAAGAAPPARDDGVNRSVSDNLSSPLADKQVALKEVALEKVVQGKIQVVDGVARVAEGEYVELEREDEDTIWTILGEFSNFAHNSIPEPDRSVDNATIWEPDFSEEYFEELLFGDDPGQISMRDYWIEQSSNRYTVNGDVTPWGEVPDPAADYGNNDCGSIVCPNVWFFVQDSAAQWWADSLAAGATADELNDYLSQFDVWDRYDYDGDGDFDEPDGYIDHFQAVHAGEGEETGGGALGSDAIWSHRWYVQIVPIFGGGPTLEDGTEVPFGGTPVGGSDYWIGDYTIEPENGGVGVFAHEFGHDLGLPDLYDVSGNTCGSACENSTGFWTLYSSGSYGNDGTEDIGSKPTQVGAYEKLFLGWLDYDVAFAGEKSVHRLGPAEFTSSNAAQALITVLPDKEVTEVIADPYAGDAFYYSGAGNDLDNFMYKEYTLPAGASLTAQVNYDIETDWDYAYLVVSTDGGATWTSVETSESTTTSPNGQNFGFGITGASGGWVELTGDLSAYTGDVLVGFRYWTDGAAVNPGFMVDEIAVTGAETDGAEGGGGFTLDGFRVTSGTETAFYFNAYIAAYRTYRGYDKSLKTGPYNFGFLDDPDLQNWVEHFPYQDGLLIEYWDTSQSDNSTSAHPGEGLVLPVDAHPKTMYRADGEPWRSRIQSYDSTFTVQRTNRIKLHWDSDKSVHRSQRGVRVFKDTKQYWNPETPAAGVINPNTGTMIKIKKVKNHGRIMIVKVVPLGYSFSAENT